MIKSILAGAGVAEAAFETRCLFRFLPGTGRGPADAVLPEADFIALKRAARRRAEGEPLQYILGEWEFFGLPFYVGEGVLIPRPDTEIIVEQALAAIGSLPSPRVLDLCAGSGCIAAAVAAHHPHAVVTAVELFEPAYTYLRRNIDRLRLPITAVQADCLKEDESEPWIQNAFDLIVSNPPYIPTETLPHLQREVRREPMAALDGGPDGLRFFREIARLWPRHLKPGGSLILETGDGQARAVCEILKDAGFSVQTITDYNGLARGVCGRLPGPATPEHPGRNSNPVK